MKLKTFAFAFDVRFTISAHLCFMLSFIYTLLPLSFSLSCTLYGHTCLCNFRESTWCPLFLDYWILFFLVVVTGKLTVQTVTGMLSTAVSRALCPVVWVCFWTTSSAAVASTQSQAWFVSLFVGSSDTPSRYLAWCSDHWLTATSQHQLPIQFNFLAVFCLFVRLSTFTGHVTVQQPLWQRCWMLTRVKEKEKKGMLTNILWHLKRKSIKRQEYKER